MNNQDLVQQLVQDQEERELPSRESLEEELSRTTHNVEFRRLMRNTFFILIVVAAVAVLIATVFFPVLRITGDSMEPTVKSGQLVLVNKFGKYNNGDLAAFYYNNKVLVKRVIGLPGDMIDIDDDGNVSVNGQPLSEDYLTDKALGESDLEYPYQVPEGRLFMMGDHRSVSIDSRSKQVGCIPEERMIGRIMLRFWPLNEFGSVH